MYQATIDVASCGSGSKTRSMIHRTRPRPSTNPSDSTLSRVFDPTPNPNPHPTNGRPAGLILNRPHSIPDGIFNRTSSPALAPRNPTSNLTRDPIPDPNLDPNLNPNPPLESQPSLRPDSPAFREPSLDPQPQISNRVPVPNRHRAEARVPTQAPSNPFSTSDHNPWTKGSPIIRKGKP
jgi:hypothetical protein